MSTEMNLAEAITYLRPIAESATVGHYAEALGLVLAAAGFRRPAQTEPTDAQIEASAIALWLQDAFGNAKAVLSWPEISEGAKEGWRAMARAALIAAFKEGSMK